MSRKSRKFLYKEQEKPYLQNYSRMGSAVYSSIKNRRQIFINLLNSNMWFSSSVNLAGLQTLECGYKTKLLKKIAPKHQELI